MLESEPIESLIDFSDPHFKSVEIKRFYSRANGWDEFIECDARLLNTRQLPEVKLLYKEPEHQAFFYRLISVKADETGPVTVSIDFGNGCRFRNS